MVGDGINANGVIEIVKKLSFVVANQIPLVWDFNDELKNLQSKLNMILAVMEDARKKQVSSEAVRRWMQDLKAIAYDADDILDNYSYEITSKIRKVRKPSLFFCWRISQKIKEINEKFHEITKPKNDLGFQTINEGSSSPSLHTMRMNRETSSYGTTDWKIVGRKNDQSNIINTLLDKDSDLVITIMGLAGLGKTTLAQLVYNDEVIRKHFDVQIWICVQEPFDVKWLFKNIASSIGLAKQYDDTTTMNDITRRLIDVLIGKKILLVLDDVWNENPEEWYKFKTLFMVCAKGSKILVTTRKVEVASIMVDKFPPYPLGILNQMDSWSLFKEIAFGSMAGAEETPKLMEIGKKMVGRCEGLPLDVISLGSLMRSKKNKEEWKIIRDTKYESREREILPLLELSYDLLPSHLKLCFSYCSIFPKNTELNRETLIQLWIAEGFLYESDETNEMTIEEIGKKNDHGTNRRSLKEIGSMYFKYLLNNFFFQEVQEYKETLTCKMHDVVHDLVELVTGNEECLIVAERSIHNMQYISKARRLRLVNLDGEMLDATLSKLNDAKKLRSLFVNVQIGRSMNIGTVIDNNKLLRVLDLSGTDLEVLPPSIGNLIHLRYLDLSRTNIIMLPESISKLYHLQTFKLVATKIPRVPKGMDELSNLKHFKFTLRMLEMPRKDVYTEAFNEAICYK